MEKEEMFVFVKLSVKTNDETGEKKHSIVGAFRTRKYREDPRAKWIRVPVNFDTLEVDKVYLIFVKYCYEGGSRLEVNTNIQGVFERPEEANSFITSGKIEVEKGFEILSKEIVEQPLQTSIETRNI